MAATTDEARAGRSERELRLLADPARAVEATKAVLAEGGERAERFFRAGFEIAYAAYNRRDWELNTLFCDIDYVFRPGSSDQQLIDANREYRGIDGYLEAQQLLLDIWAGVRIELIGVHVRPPDLDRPHRFVSFGPWDSRETVDAWRASAPFQEGVARIRELLDAFEPGTYEVSAEVSASSSP